ncbi:MULTISPECIES: multidrug efflux RND transporter permease subunit [Enterobacter cloacae complex]|uniref:multidrug efflux RND transporter permease subunit n=1 Tax=Enterobacter cloacae complex TaxID=354276 RepID=UPI000BA0D1CC|nr:MULTISPECIES: multidrug efflux RND transporter permease subunit [Enterobacter cloacae complex]QBB05325.1 multidrug efflux RND transporter permease subunit [Enterobacter cloacae]MCE1344665.1 multidrug efflux RND transporter permease subunit [Enterobacter asburiae]MCO7417343.1 multidrug efflux RND transporter permease subunit [Enterobacter asburiae]MDY3588116.1 multidrug efflux RND transporter permease subunit [Enterobacter asburiae]OZP65729.1 multidrug efflux RND transporter permease subunit
MPHFFIERPVFAWVVALFIVLAGLLSIPRLPVAQYPAVAPPGIIISVSYPGASPDIMNTSVVSLIEREISGVDNLLYFESSSDTTGSASITVTFKPGTDIKLAQMDLQNQIKIVEPRLPQAVRQNGINVEAANSGFLMMVGLKSATGQFEEADLSDYFARNVSDELRRVPGVGKVQLFGGEKALRIWLDPMKLHGYGLSVSDVLTAVGQQNALVSPGKTGDEPASAGQGVTYPITVKGQLSSVEAFRNITLKSDASGARLKLSDIARIESGLQSYAFGIRENGVPATAAAIQLSPGANAMSTASGVRARIDELSRVLPEGMAFTIPFDTAPFVKLSIMKVVQTFVEAMVLVFLVMLLFLHKIRCTLIPAIVAPVALLGTFTVMLLSGYSINILTMFGMVLAIGIIVDDAIVVVENVERLMEEKSLSPRDATRQAMKEITPAIIGITLVLTAVFIPMGFAEGSVGIIYRQFCISMAVSILLSAFLALTLTPALCATLLKPHKPGKRGGRFAVGFNARFRSLTASYEAGLGAVLKRTGRMLLLYAALCAALFLGLSSLPSSFLPDEDQGYFMSSIQLPSDATMQRTLNVVKKFEEEIAARPDIESNIMILGFGFSGSGPNSAMAFTTLKDWKNRQGSTAQGEADHIQASMANVSDAVTMSLLPPAISDMGTSSGFTWYVQDRAGLGYEALKRAADALVLQANQRPELSDVYIDGLPEGTSLALQVDREKAEAMGVAFDEINQTLSVTLGSNYVNDYTNNGRVQQVIIQADAPYRMQPEQILTLSVKNRMGQMVPVSTFATLSWNVAPQQLTRYQGYSAIRITGNAAPGESSGTAMKVMESLSRDLPQGMAGEWAGSSLQERKSESQLPGLIVLSILVVFIVLAALYESWSIPFAVMLVVPLGLIGAVIAVSVAGMTNDVFFKVGLITLIGLSAKNAILIVEFARQLHRQGQPLLAATIHAAGQRLRPILMTSLAFTLGVVPLMLANGASDSTQHAIGTGVFGGMISGTLLAIFFVPVFFIVIARFIDNLRKA